MSTPGPVLGPCEAWINGNDVVACCSAATPASSDAQAMLEVIAIEASMALFEISGRQFTGLCSRTVRPARQMCDCWGPVSLGLGPWYWSSAVPGIGGMGWRNESGDRLGCQPMSSVKLSGYPVREILAVTIDGDVLPSTDSDGHPNYRLDKWRELVRLDAPGPPVVRRSWPSCQNFSLDSGPGTFFVEYRSGVEPPELGRRAAAQLACQLFLQCAGKDCVLPPGTTKVSRQGISVERGLLANWFDPTKSTGLAALDMFLKAYWGRAGGRRPAVYSPDVSAYPRRVL
jgi:hypothetical protein